MKFLLVLLTLAATAAAVPVQPGTMQQPAYLRHMSDKAVAAHKHPHHHQRLARRDIKSVFLDIYNEIYKSYMNQQNVAPPAQNSPSIIPEQISSSGIIVTPYDHHPGGGLAYVVADLLPTSRQVLDWTYQNIFGIVSSPPVPRFAAAPQVPPNPQPNLQPNPQPNPPVASGRPPTPAKKELSLATRFAIAVGVSFLFAIIRQTIDNIRSNQTQPLPNDKQSISTEQNTTISAPAVIIPEINAVSTSSTCISSIFPTSTTTDALTATQTESLIATSTLSIMSIESTTILKPVYTTNL